MQLSWDQGFVGITVFISWPSVTVLSVWVTVNAHPGDFCLPHDLVASGH